SQPMKYLVSIEERKTGYSAFSPDLPGCVATGSGKQEVEKNMKDAIAFHLEGMDLEGLEVPQPHSFSTYLEVSA
ncbi:MAG: type II toxin-antitoxin system HicB family antitoxin, partial [Planctomycetota bacterium]